MNAKTDIRCLSKERDRIRHKASKWRTLADIRRTAEEKEPEQLDRRSIGYESILYLYLEDE